jgi:hypothetical protein
MYPLLRCRFRCLLVLCAALVLPACGSKGVNVEGKLVKDGQPYTPPQGVTLHLSCTGKAADGKEVVCAGSINASDSSFVLSVPKGKGVPPGKYKVNLNLTSTATNPAALAKLPALNAQFKAINDKEFEVTSEPNQKGHFRAQPEDYHRHRQRNDKQVGRCRVGALTSSAGAAAAPARW